MAEVEREAVGMFGIHVRDYPAFGLCIRGARKLGSIAGRVGWVRGAGAGAGHRAGSGVLSDN